MLDYSPVFKWSSEKILDKKVIAQFPAKNFYYVYKDGKYHTVHSKKSVLALFPEEKKELRKELREQKIKFRKQREIAIVTMVSRHDELTKQWKYSETLRYFSFSFSSRSYVWGKMWQCHVLPCALIPRALMIL